MNTSHVIFEMGVPMTIYSVKKNVLCIFWEQWDFCGEVPVSPARQAVSSAYSGRSYIREAASNVARTWVRLRSQKNFSS